MAAEQDIKEAEIGAPLAEIKIEPPAPTKKCKTCGEAKTFDQYYKAKGYLMGDCKKCIGTKSYARVKAAKAAAGIIKPRGFAGLPLEKRAKIFADVQAGKATSVISREQNVGLDSLRKWRATGKIVAPTPNAIQ